MQRLQLYDGSWPIRLTETFNQQHPESFPGWRDPAQQSLTSSSAQQSIIFMELQWQKLQEKPHLDHSSSVTVDAERIGRPNPAQESRLDLAELNECHFHASFPTRFLSSLFSSLSNSFMLGISAPFPSSSPSYSFLHNAYKDVPANSSSQPSSITSFLKVQLHSLGPHLFIHKLL